MPAVCLLPGMFLKNVPGIPNIVGSDAEFDNRIMRVIWDGDTTRLQVQVGSLREPTHTIEEMKKELPEWTYSRKLEQVANVGPRDFLKDFEPGDGNS